MFSVDTLLKPEDGFQDCLTVSNEFMNTKNYS